MRFATLMIFLGVFRTFFNLGTRGSDETNSETTFVDDSKEFFNDLNTQNSRNRDYERWLKALGGKRTITEFSKTQILDKGQKFRTHLLLFWIFSNASLIVIITNDDIMKLLSVDNSNSYYLAFILWSSIVFSAFKSLGCIIYFLGRLYN